MDTISVHLWGQLVGALSWNKERMLASFQYAPEFLRSGLAVSPLKVPLDTRVFEFPELVDTNTFKGLPGFIADCLPEKFGNRLLDTYLANHGRRIDDLNPLERLCYVNTRGMGALEFQPDLESRDLNEPIALQVGDLADVAKRVLEEGQQISTNIDDGIETLVTVGTSAGGAKAKAVIAVNDDTSDVLSGQANVPEGYVHWLLKFDETDNEEHASSKQSGRI